MLRPFYQCASRAAIRRRRAAGWRSQRPAPWRSASGASCGHSRGRPQTRCRRLWPTRWERGGCRVTRAGWHTSRFLPLSSTWHCLLHLLLTLLALPCTHTPALQVENFQIVGDDGRLENLVCLGAGVRVRACAECGPEDGPLGEDSRTSVDIDQVGAGLPRFEGMQGGP